MGHKNKHITLTEYDFIYSENDKGAQKLRDYDNAKPVRTYVFNSLVDFVLNSNEDESDNTYIYFKRTSKKNVEVLQAQNYVGVIQLKDGTTIEILPKIASIDTVSDSKKIFLKMLKTLKTSRHIVTNYAHLNIDKLPLLEIFIRMFIEELFVLLRKGLRSSYIQQEDNLLFLKGKLQIPKQLKYNLLHKERFFVSYDEYSPNRVENKLLKSTILFLYKRTNNNLNKQHLRQLSLIFNEILESKNYKSDFDKISSNRQMKYYEKVLTWSKVFLLGNSFTPYKGNNVAFALMFDMNLLFESYVGYWFKKKGHNIKLQDKTYHVFDKPRKFALKPDIVINDGEFILDTKWKLIKDINNISQSDIYQMFAYAVKYTNCNEVYLVYPYQDKKQKEFNLEYSTKISCHIDSNTDRKVTIQPLFFDLKTDTLLTDNNEIFFRL